MEILTISVHPPPHFLEASEASVDFLVLTPQVYPDLQFTSLLVSEIEK
jgi:hypothetical protein